MPRITAVFAIFALLLGPALSRAQDDPFKTNVRPTPWLTPDEEQRTFELSPGFEIQLFASEPDILKPMNMAFGDDGRLWLSNSQEYPYAAPPDRPGRDSIKVLEDTDGDGRADSITTFADGLNIPIGLYPYGDGVIAFSIPNIWHFRDTDGDGTADERIKLYGPFGYDRDTHGMNNAFLRGFDGWLYACHGFNNVTEVSGSDGHTVKMQSGNTYRMRLDGSRIEQFTWGQVNPFGMAIDPLDNLFTSDCHSKPIYQLLRGGYYPSFGKPHDGLGFVPPMMDHLHGSTAIAGIVFYTGENFPEEYRGDIFTGNVMTSRVNRDSLEYHGSTILAHEEPDLVKTSDPWFRPVDVQIGPDGALYVADFYNRIIGHYEVPLEHPGRDRTSGRIWRIVYTGDASDSRQANMPERLGDADVERLIAALDHPSLDRRLRATNLLVDRPTAETGELLHREYRKNRSPRVRSHALWVLFRLGALKDELLAVAAGDPNDAVRVHAMKILAEMPEWSRTHHNLALGGLDDDDAFAQRGAADALGRHPQYENIEPLLATLDDVPEDDTLLRHTLRMAIRDQLLDGENYRRLRTDGVDAGEAAVVAGVSPAIPSPESASFLLHYIRREKVEPSELAQYIQHAARFIPESETAELVAVARTRFDDDPAFQLELLEAVQRGLQQRGVSISKAVVDWGEEVAAAVLDGVQTDSRAWGNQPIAGKPDARNPWVMQRRASADGNGDAWFVCSLPLGESLTGVLASQPFEIPQRLSFYVAGHDGFPDKPPGGNNRVRLRDVSTGEVLRRAPAPRNDTAQRVEWDLADFAGRQGSLEIVDADEGPAYAWIAAGRFAPPVAPFPRESPSQVAERLEAVAATVADLKLTSLQPELAQLLEADSIDVNARGALAEALVALNPDSRLAALAPLVGEPAVPQELRGRIVQAVLSRDPEVVAGVLKDVVRSIPERQQLPLAETLAGDDAGAEAFLALVTSGQASARLLQRQSVREKLLARGGGDMEERIEELTSGLPTPNETIRKLIEDRLAARRDASPSLENGAAMFQKHCVACHQLDGKGPLIGPQLDGIGNRGPERLIEDVLDPNRNVDVAFHTTTIVMDSGKVYAGLVRREEGATVVLVDNKGKEFSLPEDEIDERSKTKRSLMPENVGELMNEQEFQDLIAFLLTKTAKPAEKSE